MSLCLAQWAWLLHLCRARMKTINETLQQQLVMARSTQLPMSEMEGRRDGRGEASRFAAAMAYKQDSDRWRNARTWRNTHAKTQMSHSSKPVYSSDLGVLCVPKFSAYKNTREKKKSSISLCTCLVMCLFYSPEYAQVWVFSGTCVRFTTSHCCSVSFCIAFCVVSALISQACISTAKPK